MYKRVEKIQEENLDWDQPKRNLIVESSMENEKIIFSPGFKKKRSVWQSITEFDIEKRLTRFVEKNTELSSLMGLLLLPYFVGFVLAYILFYSYGGMTIIGFLSFEKDHILLQLWSIGAYIFVTLWVMWAFSKIAQNGKRMLHAKMILGFRADM